MVKGEWFPEFPEAAKLQAVMGGDFYSVIRVRFCDVGPLVGTLLQDRNEESIAIDAKRDHLRPCVDGCRLWGTINAGAQGTT